MVRKELEAFWICTWCFFTNLYSTDDSKSVVNFKWQLRVKTSHSPICPLCSVIFRLACSKRLTAFKSNFFDPSNLNPDLRMLILVSLDGGGVCAVDCAIVERRDLERPNIELTNELSDVERGFVGGSKFASKLIKTLIKIGVQVNYQ